MYKDLLAPRSLLITDWETAALPKTSKMTANLLIRQNLNALIQRNPYNPNQYSTY